MIASNQPARQACDPFAASRAYPRVEVALPAFLQARGERHAVQILDLSAGGAKLNCPTGLSVETTVILDCGTLSRAAVIRWQNRGQLGICFDHELDVRDITVLSERSKALVALMKTRA